MSDGLSTKDMAHRLHRLVVHVRVSLLLMWGRLGQGLRMRMGFTLTLWPRGRRAFCLCEGHL